MVPRLAMYGLVSTTLAGGVVYSALQTRANFFAAAVAVGRSSGSLMVLANFALFNAICLGIGIKKVFFGQLRAIEYEHLFEKLWIFLTESLLALTIFRDDFSAPFAIMYGVLLFLKCFHWITADRVDYMDQIPPPGPPKSFHIRIASIILILTAFDMILASYSIETILTEGVSAMVLFASEFTILQASIFGTAARYFVGLIDLRRARGRADAPSWEEKSMYLFYVDLVVDFFKLLTYLSFFAVILLHYGLPLHILRDVYMTLRSFISRCGDLIRYRRATRDMDALYPDATEEEMDRLGDKTCIICREEMVPRGSDREAQLRAEREAEDAELGVEVGASTGGGPNETPKKLACGHVFHFHCLRSWLERQQSCPTCRRDVLRTPAPTPARAAADRAAAAFANLNNNNNNDDNQNNNNNHINQPPMPTPGAVPQPPNAPQPRPTDGQAMQQAYNEYFSLPRNGWDNPVPNNINGGHDSSTGPAGLGEEGDDTRLQRGIWGGPVIPGRFFRAPLGAAPRFPSPDNAAAGPNNISQTHLSRPTIRTTPAPPSASDVQTQSQPQSRHPRLDSRRSSHNHLSAPGTPQLSGHVTPFSSNPPVVFTSTGAARTAQSSSAAAQTAEDEAVVETINPKIPNENDARRLAAEAALRRFGITSTPAGVSVSDSGSTDGKGKGKAKEQPSLDIPAPAPNPNDVWEATPTHIPRLSNITPSFLPAASTAPGSSSSGLPRPADTTFDISAVDRTVQSLEERLRVLREVDETIWGLVGELTKLKSSWENTASRPKSTSEADLQTDDTAKAEVEDNFADTSK
ncbi:hypothetical protein I316_06051 [Kwoniella heveanensis BCC8398]|uniref:RING-type E3 ubiquitin transferase n=1 Tax=Kwoniella heveanensis BCC8398 TaxID=1296120 RepID=A0A1B9GN11_9TREE|nr:hypothetical protein I316_06051 [Kwoniella heveanensis BCC8398]